MSSSFRFPLNKFHKRELRRPNVCFGSLAEVTDVRRDVGFVLLRAELVCRRCREPVQHLAMRFVATISAKPLRLCAVFRQMTKLHPDRRRGAIRTLRLNYESLLRAAKASKRVNGGPGMDLYKLIRVADALQLGDRLFQKRLSDYANVDGWTDAALLNAVPEPVRLILKTGVQTNETTSAQLGVDNEPVRAPTLALAILGAVLQHKLKELDAE